MKECPPWRELGVSYATVNCRENGQAKPSKLARAEFGGVLCADVERRISCSLTGTRQYLIRWAEEQDTAD